MLRILGIQVKRADIWFAKLPDCGGSIQKSCRPVIVVSNEKCNYFSPTITVCPISSREKKDLATHVKIELEIPSFILCEQLMTINKYELLHFVMRCPEAVMERVEEAISIQLQKKNSIIFDINKVNRMKKAIQELEGFITRYSSQIDDLTEIKNSLNLHIAELKDYCCKCGVDYRKFYKSSKEGKMGEYVARA